MCLEKAVSFLRSLQKPGIVVHSYNPSTREVEAGGSQVQGQPGLQSEILFQKIYSVFSSK
jgi:hypothetical protein